MPLSAFNGLPPNEVYVGRTDGGRPALVEQRSLARVERVTANQAASCPSCPGAPPTIETAGAAA